MNPRALVVAFAAGTLLGTGLIVGGMADPDNIRGFLDVAGDWRPELLVVLASAVAVTGAIYALARRRARPVVADQFHWPNGSSNIDLRLVAGSTTFGVGWALSGFCPGPALASVGAANPAAMLFVATMALGMTIARRVTRQGS